jgi:hypothetical protein
MLNKLPKDIKNNIIIFAIKIQKKEILEDIINYYESKKLILDSLNIVLVR